MVSGRTEGYSSEVDMGQKRVHLRMLLTFVMIFVVAVTNCADHNTTLTSTTANTTTSRNATNPASTTTTYPAISDSPTTLPLPNSSAVEAVYFVKDPETGVVCMSVAMSISIKANYISTSYVMKETFLKIPPTAEVRGTCGGAAPTMELIWEENPTLEGTQNGIVLMFGSTNTTFFLQDIVLELYIDGKNFPDANDEGERFACELLGLDEFSASKNNRLYRCEPETTASTVGVDITIPDFALGRFNTGVNVSTTTEKNHVSGADMTQWSGYLLLAAKILIFLKLSHQGI